MAYHGYIPFISNYSNILFQNKKESVKILEIDVDTAIDEFFIEK